MDAHANSSQRFRYAASFPQLSTPRAPLPCAPVPGGARWNPETGALQAGAEGRGPVAVPPNPGGALITTPKHPFLEVSFSPPPISLLPEPGGSGLTARLRRNLSICQNLDPWVLVPLLCTADPCPGWSTRFRSGLQRTPNCVMIPSLSSIQGSTSRMISLTGSSH